jgi:hypothetical protein
MDRCKEAVVTLLPALIRLANLSYILFNLQPPTCILLQASSKSSTMPRRNLKGSRKLQFGFPTGNPRFSGGIASGTSTGGGTATGTGSAAVATNTGITDASGNGEFTITSGSSGFVDTVYGSANGSSAAGGTGMQAGTASAMLGVGTISFDGNTASSGIGGFGAGFSPVQFNTVVTEIPGSAIPATSGSPKKGGTTGGGVSPPTFVTTVVPVSTGPTGGFGSGSGALNVESTTTGTLKGGVTTIGTGSSGGAATNFGGGMGSASNIFGTAGGLGSGAGTGGAAATGNTKFDTTNGIFTGTGGATGNFNNQGSGIFGTNGVLAFP